MVADNSFIASSCFEEAPRKRHERKSSTSQVGRAGGNPHYAHINAPHANRQGRCKLTQHDEEIHQVPVGELNSSNTKTSAFEAYTQKEGMSKDIKRHERTHSPSLVGRGGCQGTGAYAKFAREHNTREERLRDEIKKHLAKRNLDGLHDVYIREHSKLPFENMEIRKWRIEVKNYIIEQLKEAHNKQEILDALNMANKQVSRFPYAKEVKDSKAYKNALDRMEEAPEAPPKMKKTVSMKEHDEVHEFVSPHRTTFGDSDNEAGSMLDSDSDQY